MHFCQRRCRYKNKTLLKKKFYKAERGDFNVIDGRLYNNATKIAGNSQIQQTEHIKQDVENQQTAAMFEQTVQKETKTAIARRNVNNDELKNDEEGGGKGKYGKNSNGKNKKSSEKTRLKILTRQRVDYLI